MRRHHRGKTYRRQAALVLAVALMLYAFASASPAYLAKSASLFVANAVVGLSASIAPNPDNTLAQALAQREAELDEREATFRNGKQAGGFFNDSLAVYSFALSIALFVLLVINYYLDWRRGRKRQGQIIVT